VQEPWPEGIAALAIDPNYAPLLKNAVDLAPPGEDLARNNLEDARSRMRLTRSIDPA
jgi:hypothetical protein